MTSAAALPARLRAEVETWVAGDPDEADREELRDLLRRGDEGDVAAAAELADRFTGRLRFGTAGLRGAVAAGPNRMNRAVVRSATAAVAQWLRARRPDAADAGVVIGCDARHRSAEFADEAARVLVGAGVRVHLLRPRQPTPLLAYAVRRLAAAAGIMITASHNPPADNGYKLYLGDGAQIIPPADAEIEAAIGALGPPRDVPLGPLGSSLVTRHGEEMADAYRRAICTLSPAPGGAGTGGAGTGGAGTTGPGTGGTGGPGTAGPGTAGPGTAGRLRVVYTPLHGVAGPLAVAAIRAAGYPAPQVVAAQAEPDPDFPTVAFPNPEQPGALDLAIEDARRAGADLVLANDPDGDRLAVAVPDPANAGGWRILTGDQVGALLGAYILERTADEPDPGARLAVTTIVSSTLLARIAAAAGARYAETLTGFKWIVRAGEHIPGSRFVFGYEEALGYVVGEVVKDKDGIGAALAVLGLAATARSAGASLLDRYDALEMAHGVHLTAQLTLETAATAEVMGRLRAAPPATLAGMPVMSAADLAAGVNAGPAGAAAAPEAGATARSGATPVAAGRGGLPPADVLIYRLTGARVVIRPSGTEPKLKAYLEVIEPVAGGDLVAARGRAGERMEPLRRAVSELLTGSAGQPSSSSPSRSR